MPETFGNETRHRGVGKTLKFLDFGDLDSEFNPELVGCWVGNPTP